jgi:anti-anti-sigma factor
VRTDHELIVGEQRRAGDIVTLTVAGEIDLYSVPVLHRHLHDLVESGELQIAIDLGGVEFMDSTGLRLLTTWRRTLERLGGRFTLADASDAVRRLLDLTGLGAHFEIAPPR